MHVYYLRQLSFASGVYFGLDIPFPYFPYCSSWIFFPDVILGFVFFDGPNRMNFQDSLIYQKTVPVYLMKSIPSRNQAESIKWPHWHMKQTAAPFRLLVVIRLEHKAYTSEDRSTGDVHSIFGDHPHWSLSIRMHQACCAPMCTRTGAP